MSLLDPQPLLQQLQIYNPAYSLATLQAALSAIPMDYGSVDQQLYQMQQAGLSGHYRNIIALCSRLIPSASTSAQTAKIGNTPFRRPPGDNTDGPGGGRGGYSCQDDSALILGAGTALTIIALMAGPFGVLAEVGFWGAVTLYGGTGTTAWGLGHLKKCGL